MIFKLRGAKTRKAPRIAAYTEIEVTASGA